MPRSPICEREKSSSRCKKGATSQGRNATSATSAWFTWTSRLLLGRIATYESPAMNRPLVRAVVAREALPVLEFLQEHHYDIGSINADRVLPEADGDLRLLCVMCTDREAVRELRQRMQQAFIDQPLVIRITSRVAVAQMPLDTYMVAFPEIPAVEDAA